MSDASTVQHYLGQLLDAWQRQPHPRIAAAFEALAAFEEEVRPRAVPPSDEWSLIERRHDPRDFGPLLAALSAGPESLVETRLRTLAARRDPRLGPALLEALTGSHGALAAELLEQLGDGRLVDAIAAASTTAPAATSARAQQTLVALRGRPAPELWPGPARHCAWAEEWVTLRPPPPHLDALFDLVVKRPDDDRPRRVYADALLEVGDRRGEVILAQLEGRPAPDSVSHEEWLRPLKAAGRVGVTRGFPRMVGLARTGEVDLSAPQWRTVEELHLDEDANAADAVRLLESDALPNLRAVEGLGTGVFSRLAPRARPWTKVSLTLDSAPEELHGLEAVTDFTFRAPHVSAGLFRRMAAVERLDLSAEVEATALRPLGALRGLWLSGLGEALELPAGLEELSLDGDFARARFEACARLERLFCTSGSLAHAPSVPSVRDAWLTVDAAHGRAFAGLGGLRHLVLDRESTVGAGQLSPLINLLSLSVGLIRDVGAAHLAGLDSLVLLSSLWDLGTLPPLPELLCCEGFLPRAARSLEVLVRAAPKLEYLHFTPVSEGELYFRDAASLERGPVSDAWRTVGRLLSPTRVRVVQLSPAVWLERALGRPWETRTREVRPVDRHAAHEALISRLVPLLNAG
ncbi:MAG: hypothetical protein U0228_07610 [Myxococcaceae bacterium]